MKSNSFEEDLITSIGGARMIKQDCFEFERYKFSNEATAFFAYKKLKELSFDVFISDNIIVLFKDKYDRRCFSKD